jgi:hypothetical protein
VSAEPPAASYVLPRLPYLRLRFVLRAERAATLVPFHGSMLRGAFGHALRQVACTMGPEQPCDSCRLRRTCAYPWIFETWIEGTPPPFLRGIPSAPRPYVFEPGSTRETLEAGEELPFDLLLIGKGCAHPRRVLQAVERMAASGLGAGRAPFTLRSARALGPDGAFRSLIEEGEAVASPPLLRPSPPPIFELPGPPSRSARLALTFATPFRILSQGRIAPPDRFRTLAFHLLRRHLELAAFHSPLAAGAAANEAVAIDWEFRPFLDLADGVAFDASDLVFHDWKRYSQRQDQAVKLGGFLGRIVIEGDLSPFAPLLRAGELFHAGKGTTFGLGRFTLEAL